MPNNRQLILPTMCKLFNNSVLTQKVSITLAEKLDANEFRELKEWLKHAESAHNQLVRKAKRPY